MKTCRMILLVLLFFSCSLPTQAQAETAILQVIKAGVKKVIRAVDLRIQRLQNQTIWLQNAQKEIENILSKLKLAEIGDWVEKQRAQYAHYFEELQKVKSILAYYHRIKSITQRQGQIVTQYKKAFALFKQDAHFTEKEIRYMEKVYSGIFDESLKNIDQLFNVINSFVTSMTDAQRLAIINEVSEAIDQNYYDLQDFNNENKLLSLQRSKNQQEVQVTKALYGLE